MRVPGAIGQTLGIIGAIVLGQAAVSAGLVSPMLIMITAITGLSSFAIPNYDAAFAMRMMRFVYILLGSAAGFYGILAGILINNALLCSMKSFGVPYFSPIAPKTKSHHDIITVSPPWTVKTRPDYVNPSKRQRTASGFMRGWKQSDGRDGK